MQVLVNGVDLATMTRNEIADMLPLSEGGVRILISLMKVKNAVAEMLAPESQSEVSDTPNQSR